MTEAVHIDPSKQPMGYNHAPHLVERFPRSPRIIALCGRKRSGKDTAAKALRCFGYKQIAFAEPLKAMLVGFLVASGMTRDNAHFEVYDADREAPLHELNGRSVRHALQTLGTEWGRDLMHPALWRDATMRAIAAQPDRRFVISDLRFPNEAMAVHGAGGVIVRIDRLDYAPRDVHISEKHIETLPVDHVIQNASASANDFTRLVEDFYLTCLA